jgi:hypothetical protein
MQEVTADHIFKEINTVSWNNRVKHQIDFKLQQKKITKLMQQFLQQDNDVNTVYSVARSNIDVYLFGPASKTLLSESLELPLVTKYLIFKAKADVNLKTSGRTPLFDALSGAVVMVSSTSSHHDYKESAMILLSHPKIDVTLADDRSLRTPLHVACSAYHFESCSDFTEIIKLLVEKGADPDVYDSDEITPRYKFDRSYSSYSKFDDFIAGVTITQGRCKNTVKVEFDDKKEAKIEFAIVDVEPEKTEIYCYVENGKFNLMDFAFCPGNDERVDW